MSANQLQKVNYWDLLTYLKNTGWDLVDDQTSQYLVFYGPFDADNHPIEIAIPRKETIGENPIYTDNAVEILSAIEGIPQNQLIENINEYDRDILRIRIIGADNAVSLDYAADQINELKRLVAYGARSEIDRKPYYIDTTHPAAKNLVDSYRFGHTFKGSFGFTIETPKILSIHQVTQLSLMPELVENKSSTPMARKVMSRIVKGLVYTERAIKDRNAQVLIRNYETAFNANMCKAVSKMVGHDYSVSVEYSIKWSALKPQVDPEIQKIEPIQFSEPAVKQLEYAAEQLTEIEPEEVIIRGEVTDLSAKDRPSAIDTSRTVNIRWIDSAEGKTYNASAALSVAHYDLAIRAHHDWIPIEIHARLSRKKYNWHFVNITEFRLIEDNRTLGSL